MEIVGLPFVDPRETFVSHICSFTVRLMAYVVAGAGKTILWYVTFTAFSAAVIHFIVKFFDHQQHQRLVQGWLSFASVFLL